MELKLITSADIEWNKAAEYANKCSWRAGKTLAKKMFSDIFTDWERVLIAVDRECIAGFCTITRVDCIPDIPYTPYIGFLFVDEKYRGERLSWELIVYAMQYLKKIGFNKVYLVSDHINLYEKYGFKVIDKKAASWGELEKVYMREVK